MFSSSSSSSSSSNSDPITYQQFIKNFEEAGHDGGRHGSQGYFFTLLLLNTVAEEKGLLNTTLTAEDVQKLKSIYPESAMSLRQEYGFDHKGAKANIKTSPAYISFVKNLEQANLLKVVQLYKSKNNELACKFPSNEERERFISVLGGRQKFSASDKFNANKTFPITFDDNDNTLYIPAYIAKNGELAVAFPNTKIRDQFTAELALKDVTSRYPGQDALYINTPAINTPGSCYVSDLPESCTTKGYYSLKKSAVHSTLFQTQTSMPKDLIDVIQSYMEDDSQPKKNNP